MFEVVLDLKGLSIPELITRAIAIKNGVSGQPVYTGLATKVTAVQTQITALQAAVAAVAAAQEAYNASITTQNSAKTALRAALVELGEAVGNTATTEEEVQLASLRLKSTGSARPVPGIPQGLTVTQGDEDGEISGQCEGQPGMVDYYEIRYTTGDPNSATPGWHLADTSKKSSFELQGLPSGAAVWVQVRAVNSTGKSAWSDPARGRVP